MRLLLSVAVVVGSALAYGWSFPPDARRWLAWIALAPLFAVLRSGSTARRLLLA